MDYETLLCDKKDDIALVTLNRPEKRNALSRTLRDEIAQCLAELEGDDNIKAIVITGNGSTFCAGFDLEEFQTGNMQEIFAHATGYHHSVYNTTMPLIAAVGGQAMAGGMDLAMMCDMRLASTDALFGQPQVKMGIPAAFDLLKTLLPESLARDLCLTGRKMNAEQALAAGLVSEIVATDQLIERSMQVASDIANSKGSSSMKARFIESQPNLFSR